MSNNCHLVVQLWLWDRCSPLRPALTEPEASQREKRFYPGEQEWNLPGPSRGAIYAERKNFGHAATGALVMFRDVLDKLMPEQWTWQPYRAILPQLPNYCVAGVAVWRTRLPLIFGSTVEWHRADRVLRQFGVRQPIPHPPVPACTLEHAMGKEYATQAQLQEMEALWYNIEAATVPGDVVPYGDAPADPLYMQWYRRVSVLCIGLPSSDPG